MINQFRLHVLLLLAIGITSCATQAQTTTEQAIELSKKEVVEFVQKQNVPGLAITVWQSGTQIWSEGFGYANLEQQTKVDPAKSKFRIGSISKPFTAAALGLLYESGKLNIDTNIQVYVPSFPKKKYTITIRQLAGHLAGIRHYKGQEFRINKHYKSVGRGLKIFQNSPLAYRPNTKFHYSSYGWNLISAALETASKDNFLHFMQKNVFDALHMEQTVPDQVDSIIPFRTGYYLRNGKQKIVNAYYVDNSYKWAGGGFLSTSEDVARFAQAHLQAGFLQQSTLDLLLTSQKTIAGKKTGYGLGWYDKTDAKGRHWTGHAGGSVGGTSMLMVYPEQELIVVILTNVSDINLGKLYFGIADRFLSAVE